MMIIVCIINGERAFADARCSMKESRLPAPAIKPIEPFVHLLVDPFPGLFHHKLIPLILPVRDFLQDFGQVVPFEAFVA